MNDESVNSQWWKWSLLIIGLAFFFLNIDPVGYVLKNIFGRNVDTWAINITLVCGIVYVLSRGWRRA